MIQPPSSPGDPWHQVFATSGYDRDRVYVKAKDGHGHADHEARVKYADGMHGMIQEMIEEIDELHSPADFFRNAAWHQLHYYAEQKKNNPNYPLFARLKVALATEAMEKYMERCNSWDEAIALLDKACTRAEEMNDPVAAQGLLNEFVDVDENEMSEAYVRKLASVTSMHQRIVDRMIEAQVIRRDQTIG